MLLHSSIIELSPFLKKLSTAIHLPWIKHFRGQTLTLQPLASAQTSPIQASFILNIFRHAVGVSWCDGPLLVRTIEKKSLPDTELQETGEM